MAELQSGGAITDCGACPKLVQDKAELDSARTGHGHECDKRMDVCCGSGRGCVGRVCVLELLFFPRSPDPSGYSLIVGVPGTSFVLRRSGGGAGLLPGLSRSANLPDLPDLLLGEAPRLKLPETWWRWRWE